MAFEIWHIWLLAAIFLFTVEIFITSFIAACVGIGALVAGISAYMGLDTIQQLLVFAVSTLLIVFFIHPFAKKIIFGAKDFVRSNADALLGKKATVVENIVENKLRGRVQINGDNWKAVSFDGKPIFKGQVVTIVSSDNVVLTVK